MSSTKADRVMFLLGSGASQPAGLPMTDELTRRVISGEGVILHTDDTHYITSAEEARADYKAPKVQEVVRFLGALKAEADRYYRPDRGRVTNYEDLFFLCRQAFECVSREFDNPGVLAFVEKLAVEIEGIAQRSIPEDTRTGAVADLAGKSAEYITDVIWRLLTRGPSRTDHLQFVVESARDLGCSRFSVTTLNHDRSIDVFLATAGVKTADGFGKAVNDVRYWAPDEPWRRGDSVPILKLHGDISWFEFEVLEGESGLPRVGSFPGADYWHTADGNGARQWPVTGRPLLLIGTTNKITQYHDRVFVDLQCAFLRELRQTRTIVCAGYGFGDKGVNRRILEWLFERRDRYLIILHPDPPRVRDRARPAIARYWDGLQATGRLRAVAKRVGDATWSEIAEAMS